MARVLLLCVTPPRLRSRDAADFVRREVRNLQAAGIVERVSLASLRDTPLAWGPEWDWLVEIHFERSEECAQLATSALWEALLGDLRLVGMRPVILVADGPEPAGGGH